MGAPNAKNELSRVLVAESKRAGCPARIMARRVKAWRSTTFTGARHELTLEGIDTAALDRWLSDLPDNDISLRRGILASIIVTNIKRAAGMAVIEIDALIVDQDPTNG